jgi:microcystin-dependent protein
MLWFDSGTGTVKQRNPANTGWNTLGTIGPPLTWTNVVVPPNAFTTGDAKITLKTVADAGWVMMNDGSIGDAASNATARAYADCQALFTLLWTNISNSWAPLQNASGTPIGRGGSAAADWAAHCRLVLPRQLGRALAIAGSGSGLTSRALGEYLGEEAHAPSISETALHGHPYRVDTSTQSSWSSSGAGAFPTGSGSNKAAYTGTPDASDDHVIGGSGGGQPFNLMQPSGFWNVMVKL